MLALTVRPLPPSPGTDGLGPVPPAEVPSYWPLGPVYLSSKTGAAATAVSPAAKVAADKKVLIVGKRIGERDSCGAKESKRRRGARWRYLWLGKILHSLPNTEMENVCALPLSQTRMDVRSIRKLRTDQEGVRVSRDRSRCAHIPRILFLVCL